ncbi:TRAP transporter large permease [Alteromonas pelagimontana]|uniref:TRAP transporter large permease protein n=1 Tax=Alteromonas pelagimontana TaxID=1858656 RepID=A0A6M4MFD8_9ALTE|nr:TRAP transporter large permease [Alteromonas pelagimontana]QJR81335.1 TRAP transporter large permease [Alteromonas pelagimontana]
MMMLMLFLLLLLLGMPLAFCLLIAGFSYFAMADSLPLMVGVQRMVASSQNFPLLAVPFFILAGHVMNHSGITERLIRFSNLLVAWIAGGLAHVTIILSALMGGVSGSAIADAAMQARILGQPMQDSGLSRGFSAAIIAVSALITACIPPSIGLILYGYVGNVSIGQLFIAGIVPGILLMFILMFTVYRQVKRHYPNQAAGQKRPGGREILRSMNDCKWALLFPVILIVTIRFGIFTPSEAGAFAVIYACAIGLFVYRDLHWQTIVTSLKDSVNDIGMIMLIILASGVVGYVVAYEQLPVSLAQSVTALTEQPLLVMFTCLLLLLFVGMLMEGTVTVLLLTPILVPVIEAVGIDPVHFGILMMIMVTFGGTTPPVGIAMYTVCNIMKCPTDSYVKDAWPFFIAVLIAITIMAVFPPLVMFLPHLLY